MNAWEKAKEILDSMSFPDENMEWKENNNHETHFDKKGSHPLISYRADLPEINGYSVVARYNVCKKCREVRNKNLTIYNEDDNVCYQKVFIEHGRDVNRKDVLETARGIFSCLVFAL